MGSNDGRRERIWYEDRIRAVVVVVMIVTVMLSGFQQSFSFLVTVLGNNFGVLQLAFMATFWKSRSKQYSQV